MIQQHAKKHSLKLAVSHLKIGHPKKENGIPWYSNHPFLGAKMLVSGSVLLNEIYRYLVSGIDRCVPCYPYRSTYKKLSLNIFHFFLNMPFNFRFCVSFGM